MDKRGLHDQGPAKIAFWLLAKTIAYTSFVVVYYFLVSLLLRNWLKHIFDTHKGVYAMTTLLLMIAQAALLDFVTVILRKLGWVKEK